MLSFIIKKILFTSIDVTYVESQPFFPKPYPQEEPIVKDKNCSFFDLDLPKPTESKPMFTPNTPIPTLLSQMKGEKLGSPVIALLQVYSRKKQPRLESKQVQDSDPMTSTKLLPSNLPSLNGENILENDGIHDDQMVCMMIIWYP